MIAREREKTDSLADFFSALLSMIDYRTPRRVREVVALVDRFGETGYYLCPRCRITLDREYMAFCDRCGQKLDWTNCQKARVIYPREE